MNKWELQQNLMFFLGDKNCSCLMIEFLLLLFKHIVTVILLIIERKLHPKDGLNCHMFGLTNCLD